jgi:hypothetical protein
VPVSVDGQQSDGPAGSDDAQLRRLILRAVAALVLVVLAGAIGAIVRDRDRAEDQRIGGSAAESAAGKAGGVAALHPPAGVPVVGYRADRAAALATSARGSVTAVLSLGQYLTEAEVRAGLAKSLRVQAFLVAAPGRPPAVVKSDLVRWAAEERAAATAERDELRRLAASADDPEFKAQYEADATILDRQLGRVDALGSVVYGAVLLGPADGFRELAGRPGVRLVDPVSAGSEDALGGLIGLRPEETVTTGNPPRRPG